MEDEVKIIQKSSPSKNVSEIMEQQELKSLAVCSTSISFNALYSRDINNDLLKDKKKPADFNKSIEFCKEHSLISCLTENNVLIGYNLHEETDSDKINMSVSFQENFSTPLYDQAVINKEEKLLIALSKRDHPITFYETANQGLHRKLKPVLSIREFKKNTEIFLSPYKMKIDTQMEHLYGGGDRYFFVYDIESNAIWRSAKMKERNDVISALDVPSPSAANYESTKDIVAIGKFDKSINIYSKKDDVVLGTLKAHIGGVTSLLFSQSDSFYLYSGARKDDLVYTWDLRKFSEFLTYYERKCNTNQRLNFELDSLGNVLHLGSQDGSLSSFDTRSGKLLASYQAHDDCLNGIKLLKCREDNSRLMATCSGQRQFKILDTTEICSEGSSDWSEDDDNLIVQSYGNKNNSINLWNYALSNV